MKAAKFLVYAAGLFFVLYGVAFALFPVTLSVWVTGGSPSTSSGVIDLRATYGGMSVAVGAILLILGFHGEWISLGLWAIAIVLLAMAATRILGIILDGSPNLVMYIYLAAELLFASLALYL